MDSKNQLAARHNQPPANKKNEPSRYHSIVAQTLGFPVISEPVTQLGYATPSTSLPVLEKIVQERLRALRVMINDPLVVDKTPMINRLPMTYQEYSEVYDPDTLQGYVSYLCDQDTQLGDLITSKVPVPLPASERRRHTYVVGAAGSGKSELLKILIHEEIASRQASVVVVDAHSDLCDQIARWPEVAEDKRLVLISPRMFEEMTPTINPLTPPEGADDRAKEIISNRLAQVIGDICRGEGGSSMSVRMVSVAKAATRILLDRPGSTLNDLYHMLADEPPPELIKAGEKHSDETVSWFFRNDWNSSDYRASKSAMRARLVQLLLHKDFRNMTCGPSTVPLYDLVESGKVILFSLGSAGTDSAKVVGKLVVSLLAALGDLRKDADRLDRKPVHIFLDECHNFIGPATQTILAELRKYGLHLTLANQYLKQIDMEDRDSVLANTAVKILGRSDYAPTMLSAMGCDDKDGREIARSLTTGNFMVKWGTAPAFVLATRSDYADESRSVGEIEWLGVRASLRAFYRPLDGGTPVVKQNAPVEPQKGFSRELD